MPSRATLARYSLAFLGAHLGFMPLLVLLLPRRVEAIMPDDPAQWLAILLICGAAAASLAHIIAGQISDWWLIRYGSRRGLIGLGATLLFASYIGLAFAYTLPLLLAALLAFQMALNTAFAPLGALLADYIPDDRKGRAGALLNAALPASSLCVFAVGWLFPTDNAAAFMLVGAVSAGCMLPLMAGWRFGAVLASDQSCAPQLHDSRLSGRDFAIIWLARFLLQSGAALVTGFLYLYMRDLLAPSAAGQNAASEMLSAISAPSALLAIVATLVAGQYSDVRGIRKTPMIVSALLFAAGLFTLSAASGLAGFLIGYMLFLSGLAAFMTIDSAVAAQLVSANPRRGMWLGVMNLTNTLPAFLIPVITLLAVDGNLLADGVGAMLLGAAVGALAAAALLPALRKVV